MAASKKYAVSLVRTVVQTATVTVEAVNKQAAAFLAAKAEPEWALESDSIEVGGIAAAGGE